MMSSRFQAALSVALASIALAALALASTGNNDERDKIDELVRRYSAEKPAPKPAEPVGAPKTSDTPDGEITDTVMRADDDYQDFAAFNPNAESLWVGAVIQAKTLKDGVLALMPHT